jgi:hypothetical protein
VSRQIEDNRLTRSQQRALVVLTMADPIRSMSFTADGTCYVTIGASRELWFVTRRGRRELVNDE